MGCGSVGEPGAMLKGHNHSWVDTLAPPLTREIYGAKDDGPGIPKDKREQLLERGTRLDSYKEGQVIGMAVVADLVSAYQGQLEVKQSDLGGAKLTLIFPTKV